MMPFKVPCRQLHLKFFLNGGVFSTSGQQYYETIAQAPDAQPFSTWVYDDVNDRVVQTANVGAYTGFVSSLPIENYVHEATLTSTSSDDDLIGLIIAHKWDGIKNHTLSAIISMGGIGILGANILSVVVNHLDTNDIIAQRSHDVVSASANSGTGWSGKEIRVKVEREGNIVKVMASMWNDVLNYAPDSEIIIDLNSQDKLREFLGPQSYGYSTQSQANSTYIDINFTGGLNYGIISNMKDGVSSVYNNGVWSPVGTPTQLVYNYPRVVSNPSTGHSFLVTENDARSYWGAQNTIEVTGERVITKLISEFEILNYDDSKTYTITSSHGIVTHNQSTFTLSDLGSYTGTVSMIVDAGDNILNISLDRP